MEKTSLFELENAQDHYNEVHRKTWTRRTTGLFAGATLGAAYGAVVGIVASFLPFVLGTLGVAGVAPAAVALPAVSAIASSAALFAGVMAVMGLAIGADVGANSASIAAALSEQEKKEKLEKSPELSAAQSPSSPESPAKKPIYHWKAAPIVIGLFAAFGAMMALSPLTASTVASLSFAGGAMTAQSTAAIAASAIAFGTAGSLMVFSNSMFTNKLSNFYMNVFSGKVFDRLTGERFKSAPEKAPAPPPQVQAETTVTPELVAVSEPVANTRRFAAEKRQFSMQSIIERTEEHGADPMVRR